MQDIEPRFPIPEHLLPWPRRNRQQESPQASSNDSMNHKIAGFCSDIKKLQDVMWNEISQRELFEDTTFQGLNLMPILGDLLMTRVKVDNEDISTVTLEAFRLAAIFYVCNLRAKFGVDTLSGGPLYATKLLALLSSSSFRQEAPFNIQIWVLSVASSAFSIPAQRDWFSRLLQEAMASQNIGSSEDLVKALDAVVWHKGLLDNQTNLLRQLF
jgi:hypothetical protein